MAKNRAAKGAAKKTKKEPRNWMKMVLPLFLVVIMLGTVVAYVAGSNWSNRVGTSSGNTHAFGSLADGLLLIPSDAGFARYADLANDTVLNATFGSHVWLMGSLPSSKIFDASPKRDLFAVYPAGYFSSAASQFVSLTDFGTKNINKSWPDSTGTDYAHKLLSSLDIVAKKVNSNYYYTPSTVPVISGLIDNIAPVAYVMDTGNSSLSAYPGFADLFTQLRLKQVPVSGMTFETAGTACNLTYSDRYYAAVGPVDPSNASADRPYSYVAIVHVVNSTVADGYSQDLALLQGQMEKMGFERYDTQVYGEYVVIEGTGSLEVCLEDMYGRWGFIKYQASL